MRVLRLSCTVFVVLFGFWTLLANAVVLSAGSYRDLLRMAPLVPIAGAAAIFLLLPRGEATSGEASPGLTKEASGPRPVLVPLGIAASCAALFAFANQYLAFWAIATFALGYFYLRQLRGGTEMRGEAIPEKGNLAPIAAAAVLALAAALILNRPNVDQTFNNNMAVSVLDNPGSPIFRSDTLHGIPGAYFIPSYRVHAFELLGAWVTQVLGLAEPIGVFQLVLAPLLAVLSVAAAGLLFRRLLPRHWGLATLALTAVLLILRQTYTMYGNFAYVRMFEGKSVFVTALVPLILVYAVEFFERPDGRKWVLLMLAQIAAVGLTANALYAAPMVAAFALGAAWHPSLSATRRLALGLSASVYPVAVGLIIRSAFLREGLAAGLEEFQSLLPMDAAVRNVLGSGATLWFWLLALTGAWSVVRVSSTRRWLLGFSFAFVFLCLNPFLTEFWGKNVTGQYLTWRLLWAVPLLVFLTVFLVEGLKPDRREGSPRWGVRAAVGLAMGFMLVAGSPWGEPAATEMGLGLRVPPVEYAVAQRLSEIAGEGQPVLAPESVAAWVPTFRRHALPLVARRHYTEGILAVFAGRVDSAEIRERLALHDLATGKTYEPDSLSLLARWLGEGRIAAIALARDHPHFESLSTVILEAGFAVHEYLGYVILRKPR